MSVVLAVLFALTVISTHAAARMARHKGRSLKAWAYLAAMIGPFALPLLAAIPVCANRNRRQS